MFCKKKYRHGFVNIILQSGVKLVVIIRFTFSPECPFVDLLSVYGTGE